MIRVLLAALLWTLTKGEEHYRLPDSVIPEHYKIQIITYLAEGNPAFTFHGDIWIDVTCVHTTKNITLHSYGLDIDEKEVRVLDVSSSKELKLTKFYNIKDNEFFIIESADALLEGRKYKIYIKFSGKLQDGLAGYYRSSYVDKATKKKVWLATTQFEATSARRAFPCFDEPAMKATFEISLGRMENYTSISNMPIARREPIKNKPGWIWDRYEISVPMSTYLVAFVVSNFDYRGTKTSNNVAFRIWARKDAVHQVEFAKQVGPKCLEYYENFFGIKYPLPKQDMIAIPDFSAGAMENWGLITYREAYLLYDPKVSTTTSQHSVSSVIAHELAHQWFGNLVTMKWWTDLWLNEGFATFMAGLAVDKLFPQWNSLQEEAADNLLSVFTFDALKSSHPVSVPIGDPSEIDEIFDTISYKKGSSLIRMMERFLGEETFRKGVSNYLKEHKYNNAEQDDLWNALTLQAHADNVLPKTLTVKTVMDSWTLQTGYPVINVIRDYGGKTVQITQERYLRDTLQELDSSCWWVPLSYTASKELDFNTTRPKDWLSCPTQSKVIKNVANENDWVIFNIQLAGVYKVNYDEKNWNMLISELHGESHKKIPTLHRVQLIDDAADLAWTGDLKYNTFFKVLDYLKKEDEYLPWKAALSNVIALEKLVQRTADYGLFKKYMKNLLTPIYQKVGGLTSKENTGDKLDVVKQQVLIVSWACSFEVGNCVTDAKNSFEKLKAAPQDTGLIPKDFRRVVYCTAVKYGDEAEWNFLWKMYQTSNVATEKNSILNALGCTKHTWLLNRFLEWSLDDSSGVRKQDSSLVFSSIAGRDVGFYIAKDFFMNNIKRIYENVQPKGRALNRYLSALSRQMSTDAEYKELESFINNNNAYFSDVKQGVNQSLETVQLNAQWQKLHKAEISSILQQYTKGS